MNKLPVIGTRDSQLALWQANSVKNKLSDIGIQAELKAIKSSGDRDTSSSIKSMGTIGVFTKAIDDALLSEEVDIAVHSLKDAPTVTDSRMILAAVLERENPCDLLIHKDDHRPFDSEQFLLATGSIRRKAQWINRYPDTKIEDLRGNVETRLRKLDEGNMDAIILANAGLIRLGIDVKNCQVLDWMIPAPAQGIVGIYCRQNDEECKEALNRINHSDSMWRATAERALLNELEGGCSAPIGAFAKIRDQKITLSACLLSENGRYRIDGIKKGDIDQAEQIGRSLAREMLENGGSEIINEIRYA